MRSLGNWAEKIAVAREARRAGRSLRGQRQETSVLVPLRPLRDLLYGPQVEGRYWTARKELQRLIGYEDHTIEDLNKERE